MTADIDQIAQTCIAVRLRMLNRVITSLYDQALRPLGLKVSQLNILIVTSKLGLARPAKVCELLHLDASTLSRNVERMRANEWLEVVQEDDARAQPFRLTRQGELLIKRAIPAWEKAQQDAQEMLGEAGIHAITKAARRLHRASSE